MRSQCSLCWSKFWIFLFNNLRFSSEIFCHIFVIKDYCWVAGANRKSMPKVQHSLHCWCCDYSCSITNIILHNKYIIAYICLVHFLINIKTKINCKTESYFCIMFSMVGRIWICDEPHAGRGLRTTALKEHSNFWKIGSFYSPRVKQLSFTGFVSNQPISGSGGSTFSLA